MKTRRTLRPNVWDRENVLLDRVKKLETSLKYADMYFDNVHAAFAGSLKDLRWRLTYKDIALDLRVSSALDLIDWKLDELNQERADFETLTGSQSASG